ncbi:MAG: hypothetical protein EOO09_22055 [Chitinophagaceae bacterium]|nr:MAG: hypothetical protein EOO09_22055 [Chitinophagaceae bacterium]
MHAVTKLDIRLRVQSGQTIDEALDGLPSYAKSSFTEGPPGDWRGDFIVSCPVAPKLAAGDFVDDLAPHFPLFLKLLQFYDAEFQLQIAVGPPGPDEFELPSHMLALAASLGAGLRVISNQ